METTNNTFTFTFTFDEMVEMLEDSQHELTDKAKQMLWKSCQSALDGALSEASYEAVNDVIESDVYGLAQYEESAQALRDRMEAYWGQDCPDYDPECFICVAWGLFRTNGTMPSDAEVERIVANNG